MEQGEFFDFLTGGQKIAFDALGKRASASGSISKPCCFRRPCIHCGKACGATALASKTMPLPANAENHLDWICAFSSLGRRMSVTVSSGRRSAKACRASPPFYRVAVGNVDFQQFQIGKQTCAAGTLQQLVPVKIVFGGIDFTVEIALFFAAARSVSNASMRNKSSSP